MEDQALEQEIASLVSQAQSLQLATLDTDKYPEISYTPFILWEEKYYIFVSELASHTQNLMRQAQLSAMIICDEQDTKNIFARQRLILKASAKEVLPDDAKYSTILDCFETQRGNTLALLRTLPDFHLFELDPTSGTYVKGFGKAYELSGDKLSQIKHITKA